LRRLATQFPSASILSADREGSSEGTRARLHRPAFRTQAKYLLGVGSEAAAPLLRLGARALCGGESSPPKEWRRGLILGQNHIGDVLYRTCSLSALHAALPNCEWDYLTGPVSSQAVEGNPAIRSVLPYQSGDDSWNIGRAHFSELRDAKYDVVLCTNILRYYPDVLLAVALGIKNRVGFTFKGLSGLVNHPVETTFPSPFPAYFRKMVSSVTDIPATWPLVPRIFPSSSDRERADSAWRDLALGRDKPVIACSITTRQPGAWPRDHFLRALETVSERTGAEIVLFGAASERDVLEEAIAACRAPCKLLPGTLNIRALAAFIGKCSAALVMDSGPRHIANAVGIPVVFGRNLIFSRVEAGRYCDNEIDCGPPDEYVAPQDVALVISNLDPARTAQLLTNALNRQRTSVDQATPR
jgi:heptosyltransferase-2